ncbi:MAG TPA: acylneuraminate cytidylyltransferase [Bellilinea sp.]|nr:acylneuraminate cytidylyltransferase [Bellilinea sp.]
MVKKPEVLAIIPARGGSKGIPKKNVKIFAGYPLIAYSIAAAKQSSYVTRVIASTDSVEIADAAREYGAEVPFLRPSDLSQDDTTDLPVFQHVLAWLTANEAYMPDVVVHLRPTSPVRPLGLVDEAVKTLLENSRADCVRGVVPAGQNPYKMWQVDKHSGRMRQLLDVPGVAEPYNAPRQSLPQAYWQTGHVDAIRSATILEKNSMTGDFILPVHVDYRYTVDLDNPFDWLRAEWLVWYSGLTMVQPGNQVRPLPAKVDLVVFDFDGVMTDNRVWVDDTGHEYVAANRSDGMGIRELLKSDIRAMVLSTETNGVVEARCAKLNLPVIQGVDEKSKVLAAYLKKNKIKPANVVYVGNDINDLPCFSQVGCAIAVADALPEVLRKADIVLNAAGGHGAVREVCERLLNR